MLSIVIPSYNDAKNIPLAVASANEVKCVSEIIIIDEIGTELEAAAARTIAERGVQLVGTAHGNELKNLIKNPTIFDITKNTVN